MHSDNSFRIPVTHTVAYLEKNITQGVLPCQLRASSFTSNQLSKKDLSNTEVSNPIQSNPLEDEPQGADRMGMDTRTNAMMKLPIAPLYGQVPCIDSMKGLRAFLYCRIAHNDGFSLDLQFTGLGALRNKSDS